ncbi:MAG TPA: hypothetical protein VFE47_22755 [Tepidisphaeraceae bacterium]|jgi:hypothetical protein|nr:hypothetical protein [Tepidisphaeraceae bacterium]
MPVSTVAESKSRAKRKSRSRADLKRSLEGALRIRFPHDTIDITDGFEGSIHVLVISRIFDRLPQRGRYAYLWKIIEKAGFSEAENDSITMVAGVSPREVL